MPELKGRKVQRFRCTIDPMLPPGPKNAFDLRSLKNWEFEMTPAGMYVKCPFKDELSGAPYQEHVIPFNNIQSIKLYPPEHPKKDPTVPETPETVVTPEEKEVQVAVANIRQNAAQVAAIEAKKKQQG